MKFIYVLLLFFFVISSAVGMNKVYKYVDENKETYSLILKEYELRATYYLDGPFKGQKDCCKIIEVGTIVDEVSIDDDSLFEKLKDRYEKQQQDKLSSNNKDKL